MLIFAWIGILLTNTPSSSENNDASITEVAPPVFSVQSGFYDEPFTLSLSADAGAKIYYTLDNTTPTAKSTLYMEPLLIEDASPKPNVASAVRNISTSPDVYIPDYPVDKCNVIKAVAIDDSGQNSNIVTGVYFVGFQNKQGYEDVNVMSLTLEPEDLFGEEAGIYYGQLRRENYNERGESWERHAALTYFTANGGYGFSQDIGVRIHGLGSRGCNQKSFNLYAKASNSDTSFFLMPLFGEAPESTCILRNGGRTEVVLTKLRDVLNQRLVSERSIAWQNATPCVLFLNGEYWGLYNLQERYDESYIKAHYSVDPNKVVIWKTSVIADGIDSALDEDKDLYDEMRVFFEKSDFSTENTYQKAQEYIDMRSFIEYVSAEIYIGNWDWPSNNFRMWRSRTITDKPYEDGKWRFMLYDTDYTAGMDRLSEANADNFLQITFPRSNASESNTVTLLFTKLMQNETFREEFKATFLDMAESDFAYERVHELLYQYADVYAKPMAAFYKRFTAPEEGKDEAYFWEQVQIIDDFYKDRSQYICEYMEQHLNGTYQMDWHQLLAVYRNDAIQAAWIGIASLFLLALIVIDVRENRQARRQRHGT